MPHSAVLLAGGKSSRMGRDKAALLVDGIPLWQRQLATLRATGPEELFISGPPGGPYAQGGGGIIVPDVWPDTGPLGGLASVLRAWTALLVGCDGPKALHKPAQGKRGTSAALGSHPRNAHALKGLYRKCRPGSSRCTTPWLMVLAVDMPGMSAAFLSNLVQLANMHGKGVIPQTPDRHFEPLAAIYPQASLPLAESLLLRGIRKMEEFARQLIDQGQAVPHPLTPDEAPLFENWNTPQDLV